MCAVCFSVAQVGPAVAVAWRARYAARLRRRVIEDAEQVLQAADEAADAPASAVGDGATSTSAAPEPVAAALDGG